MSTNTKVLGVIASAVVASLTAACGTGGHGSTRVTMPPVPSARSTSPIVDALVSATVNGGDHAAVANWNGFSYSVSATTFAAVTSATSYLGSTEDAPPGQAYLLTTVTIRNPMTDRPEPDPGFTDNGSSNFAVAVSRSSAAASGLTDACDTSVPTVCMLSTGTQSGQESPDPSDPISPQIPSGATETVQVFVGLVPASLPASGATLYLGTGTTATLIPMAR